ncbi:methyl-accepting chemotaxis protein [Paludibacterium sp.]|uniref:methyl-accepting chemotaxis protein n=1 Tax=Paludibacterium sp. TaxID=1917523 RepID=UPI0025DCB6AA|nr:methyl-accepting chemotaxis protein [Paludibacterium sp.]MBV8646546.1 methyl-accepting chemotaxis protein [Paludibacterium sp.]
MFARFSIGVRLGLAFAVVLGLLLAVAGFALQQMRTQQQVTERIVQQQVSQLTLAESLQLHANGAALPLLTLLLTKDQAQRIPLYQQMDSENTQADQALAALGKGDANAQEAMLIQTLSAARKQYADLFHETVIQIEVEGPEGAHQHFIGKTQPALRQLLQAATALVAQEQRAMGESQAALTASLSQARVLVLAMTAAAVVLGTLFALLVTRGIVTPIRRALAFAAQIAHGELGARLDVTGGGEPAQLAQSLLAMRQSLSSLIGAIHRSASEVETAAGAMHAPVDQVRQGSSAQHRAVSAVSESVEGLVGETRAIAAAADETRDQAERARNLAQQGCEMIAHASREVARIAVTVTESAHSVEALREQALSVRQMLDTVKEIADQTNLLALNASIEAARAGEMGRGFAVVADEVRKLADRTSQATSEIHQVITAIDDETGVAVARIGQGREEMQRGVALIGEIVQPLTQLSDDAQLSLDKLEGMRTTLTAQVAQSQAVASLLREIGGMATDNLTATGKVSETQTRLGELSVGLGERVSRFRLADGPSY